MKFQCSFLPGQRKNQSGCFVVFIGVDKNRTLRVPDYGIIFDKKISSFLASFASEQEFEGKVGHVLLTHNSKGNHMILAGVGEVKKLTMKDWLDVMATVGREAKKIRAKHVMITLDNLDSGSEAGMTKKQLAEGVVEGMTLGTYTFNRYKKMEKKEHEIETVSIISDAGKKDLEKGIHTGEIMSRATTLARDLVNEPSSVTTPTFLSLVARDIAKKNASITCDVLEKKDMEKLGMGGILGIAKGSDEEPKLIKLTFRCHPEHTEGSRPKSKQSDHNGISHPDSASGFEMTDGKTIVLVGKGVTFDSGGLSLKSQEGMETMKIDMAGAASILGIFSVLSELQPNATVIGIIPAVENMPSGKAIKPGDVVKAYGGKTIEVISTDAEGRVILADALAWAGDMMKPDVMIDLATLTGACMIALGEDIAGLFTTNETLGKNLIHSSEQAGEALWELPLPESYNDLIKSDIADIRNVSKKRYGGAITAALFLNAFVPENVPWAHLDIAGPAVAEKDAPLTSVGATGFGVRLILEYLTKYCL